MFERLCIYLAFLRDRRASAAVEFALVAPVFLLLTVGAIDVGRLVWSASALNHLARETTRYASVRGAESQVPATQSGLQTFVANRLIAMNPNDLTVTVTWDPNNNAGNTVQVQLDYQFIFLLGGLVGLDPIQLQGDSVMVVL